MFQVGMVSQKAKFLRKVHWEAKLEFLGLGVDVGGGGGLSQKAIHGRGRYGDFLDQHIVQDADIPATKL